MPIPVKCVSWQKYPTDIFFLRNLLVGWILMTVEEKFKSELGKLCICNETSLLPTPFGLNFCFLAPLHRKFILFIQIQTKLLPINVFNMKQRLQPRGHCPNFYNENMRQWQVYNYYLVWMHFSNLVLSRNEKMIDLARLTSPILVAMFLM